MVPGRVATDSGAWLVYTVSCKRYDTMSSLLVVGCRGRVTIACEMDATRQVAKHASIQVASIKLRVLLWALLFEVLEQHIVQR